MATEIIQTKSDDYLIATPVSEENAIFSPIDLKKLERIVEFDLPSDSSENPMMDENLRTFVSINSSRLAMQAQSREGKGPYSKIYYLREQKKVQVYGLLKIKIADC